MGELASLVMLDPTYYSTTWLKARLQEQSGSDSHIELTDFRGAYRTASGRLIHVECRFENAISVWISDQYRGWLLVEQQPDQ